MAFNEIRDLRESINALMDEIEANPDSRPRLQAELHEKATQLEALGQVMPDSYRQAKEEADEGDDFFDNMPV